MNIPTFEIVGLCAELFISFVKFIAEMYFLVKILQYFAKISENMTSSKGTRDESKEAVVHNMKNMPEKTDRTNTSDEIRSKSQNNASEDAIVHNMTNKAPRVYRKAPKKPFTVFGTKQCPGDEFLAEIVRLQKEGIPLTKEQKARLSDYRYSFNNGRNTPTRQQYLLENFPELFVKNDQKAPVVAPHVEAPVAKPNKPEEQPVADNHRTTTTPFSWGSVRAITLDDWIKGGSVDKEKQ